MKTTSKRVISLLLAIMMVLSIFTIVPMTASAAVETLQESETIKRVADDLLKANAEDNSHAKATDDGPASLAFDESNTNDLWHTAYKNATARGTDSPVGENNPLWVQTGFKDGETYNHKYVTAIGYRPRIQGTNAIKGYKIYVWNKDAIPAYDSPCSDWELVKTGTLDVNHNEADWNTAVKNKTGTRLITLDEPVEATYIRIVATSTNSANGYVAASYFTVYEDTAAATTIKAKALYKNHKIEWKSKDATTDNFKIYSGENAETQVNNAKITKVTVDNYYYYTALVPVTTGTGKGTKYTVKNVVDSTETLVGTGVVADDTGREALIKNAIVTKDYRNTELGYKKFTSTNDIDNLNISKATIETLKTLSSGAMIISVSRDDSVNVPANRCVLSLGTTRTSVPWVGTRGSQNNIGFEFNEKWKANGVNLSVKTTQTTMALSVTAKTGVVFYANGEATYTGWQSGQSAATFIANAEGVSGVSSRSGNITGAYIGGAGNTDLFQNGKVYFALVSEETYTSADLQIITQSKYNDFSTALENAEICLNNIKAKRDANYETLKNDVERFSSYNSSMGEKEYITAIATLNDDVAKLNYREVTGLTEEKVDVSILKKNADDNSHDNYGTSDGPASYMFDSNNNTWWHSIWHTTAGAGMVKPYNDTINVNAQHPVWVQTGFDTTEYITKLECAPRENNSRQYQIKQYAVYVSTNDTAPAVMTSATGSDDWTLVANGTLSPSKSGNQVITFQPVEAKWVRLVIYSTQNANGVACEFATIVEMSVYKATDNCKAVLSANSDANNIIKRAVVGNATYETLCNFCNADLDLSALPNEISNAIDSIKVTNVDNKIAIDKTILKDNAKANTYANKDGDRPAYAAFDNNNSTWWHTNWKNSGGEGDLAVAKDTPAWIQTGFGETPKVITSIDFTHRTDQWGVGKCRVKDYAIYVSNAEQEPDVKSKITEESQDWKLVTEGTLAYCADGTTQTITFQPVEAKWVRFVVYTALDGANTSSNYVAIVEMNIYEVEAYTHKAEVINNNLTDKLSQAKKLALRADIDANALNTAIESLGTIDLTKLTEQELQAKLDTITGAVSTTPSAKTLNKSGEQSFDSDSVKWNNSNDRLQILQNNAEGTKAEGSAVTVLFDGDTQVNVNQGVYYGTYNSGTKTPWVQTGFNNTVCLSGIVVYDRYNTANNGKAQDTFDGYEIWVSNDKDFATYEVAATGTRTDKTYTTSGYAIKFATPYNCKYVRFNMKNSTEYLKLCEIDIYEYVGMKSETATTVTVNTDACTVANDKLLNTVDFNFNKMFTDGFTKAEIEKQVLDIELSDISHNYEIVVGDDAQVSIVATDATYNLTVSANGTTTDNAQTKKYGENFDYTVENAKGWQVDGKVIANGNTFNFMATDDVTVTAITDTVSTEVSVYIPEPVVGFDGTKTTVQIPVYINGVGTETDVKKGIVLVKPDVTDEEAIKADIKSAIDGTPTTNVKISEANGATLSNKGRYIHTIKANGKLTTGTFYAYVIVNDEVKLSNAQVIGG